MTDLRTSTAAGHTDAAGPATTTAARFTGGRPHGRPPVRPSDRRPHGPGHPRGLAIPAAPPTAYAVSSHTADGGSQDRVRRGGYPVGRWLPVAPKVTIRILLVTNV